MEKLMIKPEYTPEFLQKNNLGIEAHIGRYDKRPNWSQYVPFVHAVHLPYANLNLAAFDDVHRRQSIETLKRAIDIGCQYPVDRMVMHTIGTETRREEIVGCYERMIDGLRELADYAAGKRMILCVENQVLHPAGRRTYGSLACEWLRIYEDVNRSNVLLTLDSSHAATVAAAFEKVEDRIEYLFGFLKYPERIGRVHWNDASIMNREAFCNDMHQVPGEGDLPVEFHRRIKQLDVVKTLELKRSEEEIEKGLAFIESL